MAETQGDEDTCDYKKVSDFGDEWAHESSLYVLVIN